MAVTDGKGVNKTLLSVQLLLMRDELKKQADTLASLTDLFIEIENID